MKALQLLLAVWLIGLAMTTAAQSQTALASRNTVKIIFDTDIGNDVDDVMALAVLHALQTRHACELLAVTTTKPSELSGPFVSALNTFYGRPKIPVGCIASITNEDAGRYLPIVNFKDNGRDRYPRQLKFSSKAPSAMKVLRQTLARAEDHSVVLVQVGYFSNLAALLETGADKDSPLTGVELVKRKVKMLSLMGGSFKPIGTDSHVHEFNVIKDLPAAKKLVSDWPTPIVWSGAEVGIALPYPAASIKHDFSYVPHHIVAEAYYAYNPPPHERPTWDLTSVLYAVHPDRNYFELSEPGRVVVEADGETHFIPRPQGRDRYLILRADQISRVKEALVQLTSQPPASFAK